MENSAHQEKQQGFFTNVNAEETLYENMDCPISLSLDPDSINNDKEIKLKITNKNLIISFKGNESAIFSFCYDELIYHALSKQKNYVMIQLNLKEDFLNWIKKEDKIYLKCFNKEEEIIFEKISIGCSINTEYPDADEEMEEEFQSYNAANLNNNPYLVDDEDENSEDENNPENKYYEKLDKIPHNFSSDMGTIYFNNPNQLGNIEFNNEGYQIPENTQHGFYTYDNSNQINFGSDNQTGNSHGNNYMGNMSEFRAERFLDADNPLMQPSEGVNRNLGISIDNVFKTQKKKKRLAENDPRRFEDL